MKKNLKAYKTIGEVAEILELVSTKDKNFDLVYVRFILFNILLLPACNG